MVTLNASFHDKVCVFLPVVNQEEDQFVVAFPVCNLLDHRNIKHVRLSAVADRKDLIPHGLCEFSDQQPAAILSESQVQTAPVVPCHHDITRIIHSEHRALGADWRCLRILSVLLSYQETDILQGK